MATKDAFRDNLILTGCGLGILCHTITIESSSLYGTNDLIEVVKILNANWKKSGNGFLKFEVTGKKTFHLFIVRELIAIKKCVRATAAYN